MPMEMSTPTSNIQDRIQERLIDYEHANGVIKA